MDTFYFVFTLHNFDRQGEEHRLRTTPIGMPNRLLELAVKNLLDFAARLLKCQVPEVAAKQIMLKSAWRNKKRINSKELLEAMLQAGISAKGRNEQRISVGKR